MEHEEKGEEPDIFSVETQKPLALNDEDWVAHALVLVHYMIDSVLDETSDMVQPVPCCSHTRK